MIIKNITLNNFRSYYGETTFDFKPGLTLIIGDNGDGKTTFFDALSWLLETELEKTSITYMSEMRKSELEIGETEKVSVSMTFDHDGEKMVEKSFLVKRTNETKYATHSFSFKGYETQGSERVQISGKALISRCFDAFIRRYSMFKGESTLNVLDDPDALKMLVDKLSDIHEFDEYVKMAHEFEQKSSQAYENECKRDNKTKKEASLLEAAKKDVIQRIDDLRRDIREAERNASLFGEKIEVLEKNQEASERYQKIKGIIKAKEEDVREWRGRIAAQNFNIDLLDRLWILAPFTPVQEEFRAKVSSFSKEKRRLNDEFIAQRAKDEGRKETLSELSKFANGITQLPWYLPDQETMQEMIDDETCKVCGRPAPKGSEAYEFMVNKLRQFRENIAAKQKAAEEKIEEKQLFINNYIEQLHNLSISLGGSKAKEVAGLYDEITDKIGLIERFKSELAKAEEKLQEANDDKARLLIQVDGVTEDQLDLQFHDLKGYFEQKSKAEKRLVTLQEDIKREEACKKEIEAKYEALNPGSSVTKTYQKVHIVLRHIADAFSEAKGLNLRRFLDEVESLSNNYLKKLNTDDFHGIIRLVRTVSSGDDKPQIRIRLLTSNGGDINDPSGSQLTTMYMSILFAISELTSSKRDEDFPLIFDAPTSSFGGMKESGFYNIINSLDKQCIIVTKDFLDDKGSIEQSKIDQLTCSVYRIKKAEGFDPEDLSTIQTTITAIK